MASRLAAAIKELASPASRRAASAKGPTPTDDAAAAYHAAVDSPIRYDLELASGRYVDSRWAARTALANLNEGRPLLALAR